jgi:hypothetical protein
LHLLQNASLLFILSSLPTPRLCKPIRQWRHPANGAPDSAYRANRLAFAAFCARKLINHVYVARFALYRADWANLCALLAPVAYIRRYVQVLIRRALPSRAFLAPNVAFQLI